MQKRPRTNRVLFGIQVVRIVVNNCGVFMGGLVASEGFDQRILGIAISLASALSLTLRSLESEIRKLK